MIGQPKLLSAPIKQNRARKENDFEEDFVFLSAVITLNVTQKSW